MKAFKIAILLLGFLSVFVLSCGKKSGSETNKQEDLKLTLVRVQILAPQKFSENFRVAGVIKPFASAKVSSEEGGLILSIPKDKGSFVSKGETVVRIKKDVEEAVYSQTEAQVELARLNFEKQKLLYDENATTELQYLNAKWQYEAAVRGLEVLSQKLKSGTVRAPINGVIDDRFMNKGEMSAPGAPILSIVDVSSVKVSAGVPESNVKQISKGQSVLITVDVLPGVEFEGKVNYIAPALDNISRTFEIEIIIGNRDRLLKPGMNANVEISRFSIEDAIVVPQDLIIDYGEEQFVFVLESDVVKKRVISIGGRDGNNVLIESGLNTGDKIITDGYQSVRDGEKVQVVE